MTRRMVLTLALCGPTLLFCAACSAERAMDSDPLLNVPVDMNAGASSLVLHRPLPVGTRVHAQGVYRKHHRVTALASGYVVKEENENLQIAYDLQKTFLDIDLMGNPKRVRYGVVAIESTNEDLPAMAALGEGRAVQINAPNAGRLFSSGGQELEISTNEGQREITVRSGELTAVERQALSDPFGPGYELGFEQELARLFGPKEPKRVGDEWDVDLVRARALLERLGELVHVSKITGRVTFAASEKQGNLSVHRIEAWIKGEGKIAHKLTYKVRANTNQVELKYTGVFPVDLSLPPISHDWTVKGTGHLVVEVNDILGDIQFESLSEHQSRVVDLQR